VLFSLVRTSESTQHGLLSGEWINGIFLSSNSPSWSYLHPTVLMGYMGCKSNAQLLVPEKKIRMIFPHLLWLAFLALMVHTGSAWGHAFVCHFFIHVV